MSVYKLIIIEEDGGEEKVDQGADYDMHVLILWKDTKELMLVNIMCLTLINYSTLMCVLRT